MAAFNDVTPAELAAAAAALSDPTRAAIIITLLDGRARTAGELATVAGVTPQTISSHIHKLVDGRMLVVTRQGRHHYHHLARPEAIEAIEGLTSLAAGMRGRLRRPGPRDEALRAGRTCYDHFAGRFGVSLTDALRDNGALVDNGRIFEITPTGERLLAKLGVDVPALRQGRRPICRRCIDWSERRPHLAGTVGATLTLNAFKANWVQRVGVGRAVQPTTNGLKHFRSVFGANFPDLAATCAGAQQPYRDHATARQK